MAPRLNLFLKLKQVLKVDTRLLAAQRRHPGSRLRPSGSQRAPAFVAIPDNAVGVSGMTSRNRLLPLRLYAVRQSEVLAKSAPAMEILPSHGGAILYSGAVLRVTQASSFECHRAVRERQAQDYGVRKQDFAPNRTKKVV
jgi:hypothetical protein